MKRDAAQRIGGVGGLELRRTRGSDFEVRSLHAGSGDAVVLLHGLCGSHRWWRYTTPALTAERAVHVPELVGLRTSAADGGPATVAGAAGVLTRWWGAAGLGPGVLVGHSLGGQIGIHMAAARPDVVRRLVLVNSAGLLYGVERRDMVRLALDLLSPGSWGAPEFLPSIALDALRTGPRAVLSATRNLLGDEVRPLLRAIEVPTLVIWGDRDPILPLAHGREMARLIPGARLAVVAGAAHNPMIDRPAEFNRLVLDFLA